MSPRKMNPVGDILVVDDMPSNLEILTTMLKECGHRVRPVPSGRLALEAARLQPPDLILLDINMPGMDGYQVCASLKADEKLAAVPVIFISANNEVFDKVTAFNLGGVDYVTKPFQFEEVEARVETHLELRRQRVELEKSYQNLAELEALRDSLVHMIVHDLRSPLAALVGNLELLKDGTSPLEPDQREDIEEAYKAAKRMILMVTGVLDVHKLEAGRMSVEPVDCDARAIAREVIESLGSITEGRDLSLSASQGEVRGMLDKGILFRVLQNLVANALKFTPPQGGTVQLQVDRNEDIIRFVVKDNGPGIPPEYHGQIFEKFGQVAGKTYGRMFSTGLGLPFCKLAVEAHGGQIGVESEVGKGSTFWVYIPVLPRKAESRA